MVEVEVANRSGVAVNEHEAVRLVLRVLEEEGIADGELGLAFVDGEEARALKLEHLGIDETPDVLSFPIDGREELPAGVPRQLGDVVVCPEVVGEDWREPLVHGLLHLLGYDHGDEMAGAGGGASRVNVGRSPSVLQSFNFAFEGIIHVLRTQRNMRIHFMIAAGVLIGALIVGVSRLELVILLMAISFVLIAEMINSALEAGIDVATTSFDPLAKLAKDIAAGAVLIATINALAVGYLVFVDRIKDPSSRAIDRLRDAPTEITLVALVLTVILVIGAKAYTGRGRPLRGGLPSGHSAIAFAGWMAATYILGDSTHWFLISTLTFIMALLVAQTRIEAGIHSFVEVLSGGVLGALVTLVLFQLFWS